MKARKNKKGEYTLYEVTGADIFGMALELKHILESAEEAGLKIEGYLPGEEVMEMYVMRDANV